ncbi:MAG: flavin reductase family protein [Dehalococcoidia bacterium]
MPDGPSIDPRAFRDVIGRFATGVTVITMEAGGKARAMTANAVSSLSLDPPLLLVCIDRKATMHQLFEVGAAFAVNILVEEQRAISDFFARSNDDENPMGNHAHRPGDLGAPLIEGALAHAECRVAEQHAGGDHTIVIGRVESMAIDRPDAPPLLFYTGRYHSLGLEL